MLRLLGAQTEQFLGRRGTVKTIVLTLDQQGVTNTQKNKAVSKDLS